MFTDSSRIVITYIIRLIHSLLLFDFSDEIILEAYDVVDIRVIEDCRFVEIPTTHDSRYIKPTGKTKNVSMPKYSYVEWGVENVL